MTFCPALPPPPRSGAPGLGVQSLATRSPGHPESSLAFHSQAGGEVNLVPRPGPWSLWLTQPVPRHSPFLSGFSAMLASVESSKKKLCPWGWSSSSQIPLTDPPVLQDEVQTPALALQTTRCGPNPWFRHLNAPSSVPFRPPGCVRLPVNPMGVGTGPSLTPGSPSPGTQPSSSTTQTHLIHFSTQLQI